VNEINQRYIDDQDSVPSRSIRLRVNRVMREVRCEDRQLLVEVIRGQLGLKGTHVGCLNGDCGACTVMVNGRIVKSCLMLAASADGADITTVEGFATGEGLDPIQDAFWSEDGFQCGFCLPGHLFAARALLTTNANPTDAEVREALAGNLCRCTGYVNMVKAVRKVARGRTQAPGTTEAPGTIGG